MKYEQWLKLTLIIAFSFLGYGFINYFSQLSVLGSNKQIREAEEANLKACKEEAKQNYNDGWNLRCETNGVDKKTDDCSLPNSESIYLDALKEKAIENCISIYAKLNTK